MVSIIIVTLGEDAMLRECVASINEHVGCSYEIILVNNSTTPIGASSLSVQTIVENMKNMGFARAVNRGIEAGSGDMILLLNSDTLLTGDIISPMVTFLSTHEDAGICGPQLVFPDGSLQNSIDVIPDIPSTVMNKAVLRLLFPSMYPSKRSGISMPVRVESIIGACMLMKRSMVDAIGMLDEGFFFYLEETDFCKRAQNKGFEVWHLPDLKIIHYQGKSARKSDVARKIEFHRSMFRFFLKNKGLLQTVVLYIFMIIKMAFEVITGLPAAFSRRSRKRLRRSASGLVWYLTGMPRGWGLEKRSGPYRTIKAAGYSFFLPHDSSMPAQGNDIENCFNQFRGEVLNRSRTTTVKTGMMEGGRVFFKRYNFKGIKDTIKNMFRKGRARRSFEAAVMVQDIGLDTAPVCLACEKRVFGILMGSYIITRAVDAVDLVTYFRDKGFNDEQDIIRVAGYIRRMHEMGIVHIDLKGENILLNKDTVYIIDLDRLKRVRFLTRSMRARNLSYLYASFAKEIPPEKALVFLREYIKGNTVLEDKRDEFISQIKTFTDKRLRSRY